MIHRMLNEFHHADRDIDALTYILLILLLVLAGRVAFFVYEGPLDQFWTLLAPTITVIAALLVVRVANRLIINNNIVREDERRQDIVRTTHHLITITTDLKGRIAFVKKLLDEGSNGGHVLGLSQIAATIEDRYETLLDREAYKLLPEKCVELIVKMSGNIFGISLLAAGTQHVIAANPAFTLQSVPNKDSQLAEVMADIQELIDELYRLRESVK